MMRRINGVVKKYVGKLNFVETVKQSAGKQLRCV